MLAARVFRSVPTAVSKANVAGAVRSVHAFGQRHENNPEIIQQKKDEIQSEVKQTGHGREWKEEVASDSEAFVKSIRQEYTNSKQDIEALQKETEQTLNKKRQEEKQ